MANSRTLGFKRSNWAIILSAAALLIAGCGGQAEDAIDAAQSAARVDNPLVGVTGYVNSDWKAHALAEQGGDRVASTPTAIWLRTIASITAKNGGTSLRQHLDNALAQGAGYIEVVLYDVPGRGCANLVADWELGSSDLSRYESLFVDAIAAIEADSKYSGLRIVNIIEPDSLVNLVTDISDSQCGSPTTRDLYVASVQYALGKLGAIPNAYNYLDIGNHGVLGWSNALLPAADLFASTIRGAAGGFGTVAGLVSNVANYAATVEPFFSATTTVNGTQVRKSKWVDWADYVDEATFASAMRDALVSRGLSASAGLLIDTSRNGWGGVNRPTKASTATDLNEFVNASRTDRRIHAGNWCNQSGAGLGERPRVVGANGLQAYVWIKPPGESDGASTQIPQGTDNPDGEGVDPMCDPSYGGNARNANNKTGALSNAPVVGRWFSAEFQELMANAYPPLGLVTLITHDTTPPTAPSNLVIWNPGITTATLSWGASMDDVAVVAYDIDSLYGGPTLISSVQKTTAQIGSLQPGTTYTFVVRARDAAGNVSAPSNSATFVVTCCVDRPPDAPTDLSWNNSDGTVVLSWVAPAYGSGLTYRLYYGNYDLGVFADTSVAVIGFKPGTPYTFTVKAVDSFGNASLASNSVTVLLPVPKDTTPPSRPTNLSWTSGSGGAVRLSWTASTDDGGVVLYQIYSNGLLSQTVAATTSATFQASVGQFYELSVKAIDGAGNVSPASEATFVYLGEPPNPPSAPTKLQASNTAGTPVQLVWTPGTGGAPATTYQVYRDGLLVLSTTLTSVVVTAVAGSTTYSFTVKAVAADGNLSAASAPVAITTNKSTDTTPPSRPSHLRITQVTSTSVSLTWNASTDNVGVIAYEVFAGSVLVGMPIGTSTTISGLAEGQSYSFTVSALDAVCSVSQASSPVTVTPGTLLDSTPPTTPTNLAVGSVAPWTATLTWTGSRDVDSWMAGYDVYVKYTNGSNVTLVLVASSTTTAATVNGLYAGTYSLVVRARDAVGNESSDSNTVTVTIPSP
jgi:cellulose 1,4-beta-cellobiosidase